MPPLEPTTRRAFVKTAGVTALGASLFPDEVWAQRPARRRYAIVGTGDRGSGMWWRDLAHRYAERLYERQRWTAPASHEIYLTKSFGQRTLVPVPKLLAGHGGGDDRLRDLIFKKTAMPDYMRLSDSRAGAMSCLTGITIRNSIDQRKPIRIANLVTL